MHWYATRLHVVTLVVSVLAACSPLRYPDLGDGATDARTLRDDGDISVDRDADAPPIEDALSPDSTEGPDAGTSMEADGGEQRTDADAPDVAEPDASVDAGLDATIPDATPPDVGPADSGATITVTTIVMTATTSGLTVMLHDDRGALLASTTTGAGGEALLPYVPRSLVTAVLSGSTLLLESIQVSEPEQQVVIDISHVAPSPRGAVNASFVGPASGASIYEIDFGCGAQQTTDATQSLLFPLTSACVGRRGLAEGVATAIDPQGLPIAYALVTATPVRGSTTAASFGAWRAPTPICSFHSVNPPAQTGTLQMRCDLVRDGVGYRLRGVDTPWAAGAPIDATTYGPPGFGDRVRSTVTAHFTGVAEDNESRLVQMHPLALPVQVNTDLSTALLPRVHATALSWTPRPQLAWAGGATGPGIDALLAFVSWPGGQWWIMLAPDNTSPVELPVLPTTIPGRPTAADAPEATIMLVDVDTVTDYRTMTDRYSMRFWLQPELFYAPPLERARASSWGLHLEFCR